MPFFRKNATNQAYNNYATEPVKIPKDIPKYNESGNIPNIIIPSFVVSLSQSIISFVLRRTSKLPLIGTKNGEIREFEVDEFHILLLILLGGSIHYYRKYKKENEYLIDRLNKLMIESKIHNFSTLAAVDNNNIKRIECIYYKNQFQLFDLDLYTRHELRSYIQILMAQCDLLSKLSIKILEEVNSYFKTLQKNNLLSLYEQQYNQIGGNNNNNNNDLRRSNAKQQRLKLQLRNQQHIIDEEFDRREEKVDTFQSFFDDKNNEQYLIETRDQQRIETEKEILDGYKDQKEAKLIEINAKKMELKKQQSMTDNDESKMTEQDDDENAINQHPLQQRTKLLNIEMNYDHEYLVKQADNLPIQQIDFSSKQISRYNLQKQVNQMKYDIILKGDIEKKREKIRKYGIMTLIVTTTAFAYYYNRIYEGKGVVQRIRDTKARLFSYF